MDPTTETLIELNAKLERLINGIDTLHANQERMGDDISKIKEAVYNPDSGLYASFEHLSNGKTASQRFSGNFRCCYVGCQGFVGCYDVGRAG